MGDVIPLRRRKPRRECDAPAVGYGPEDIHVTLDGVEHHLAPEDALALATELTFAASEVWAGRADR